MVHYGESAPAQSKAELVTLTEKNAEFDRINNIYI